ncbi:MAG: vWA domain-containing protein [Ardenticatenaceae bacterium]
MGFAAPLGLLALVLLAPVVAMYLLKRRRDEVLVSSVYLWERVVQDIEANAPWQRLRRNLLLLLQLLFLLLAIFGLARPFVNTTGVAGQSLIVVLDSSISMGANDTPQGTRLEAARAETLRLMEEMPDNGRITVLRGGDGADILVANSDDRVSIQAALAEVEPLAGDSDLGPALTLAAAVAARESDSEIVVLSDGNVQLPNSLAVDRAIRYVPIGVESNNQAISVLNLTRTPAGYDLFVQVSNYGAQNVTRRLIVAVDGEPFTATDLTIPAGEQTSKIFSLTRTGAFRVEARLAEAEEDRLASDDVAWAVPGASGERKVRLLSHSGGGEGGGTLANRFLSVPFAILSGIEFSQGNVLSDTFEVDGEPADLLILDRWLPPQGLPGSTENLLIVTPPAGHDIIQTTGVITAPVPFKLGTVPAIEDNLFFESDLFFVEARKGIMPAWGTAVLQDEVSGEPLLWVGEQEGRRIAVLNLAIYGEPESIPLDPPRDVVLTNLVYQPTYPVLIASLADYLLVGPAGGLAGQSVSPGQAINLPLLDAQQIEIETPSGQTVQLDATEGARTVSFVPTEFGIYTTQWAGNEQPPIQFTVNLFAPTESHIAPVPQLALATTGNGTLSESGLTGQAQRELWRPLLLIGLIILALEWMVYQKDAILRLRSRIAR